MANPPRMLTRTPPTGARLPVGAPVAGRPGLFRSPAGSKSAFTMTGGAAQRAFAPVPGYTPPAPAAPPRPGMMGADGSIDLLAYGRPPGDPRHMPTVDPGANNPAGVDLLAWNRDNGLAQPGAATGLTAAPPPPQTERVSPLAGDVSNVAPGKSAPFTPPSLPVAKHVGGEGSYMREFSNPQSAGMYESYVKGLFGGKSSPRRTPLTRSPAQPAYAGD